MKRCFVLFCALLLSVTAAMSRGKIGLVLGGGGAKGAAEVGVLKVLEREGIRPDYICGTSIGSIVGALYAAGYTAAELDSMFQTQEWLTLLTDRRQDLSGEPYKVEHGVTYVFGFPVRDENSSGFGLMRGNKVEHLVDSMAAVKGCKKFCDLKIPFSCVAADFMNAREVVLSEGALSRAIRASMAIPGVFKPVDRNGVSLVDGGMMNNLPVDVCRRMGADVIIAVDLQQQELKARREADLSFITPLGDLLGFGGLLEWVTNRPDIAKYQENVKRTDVYIHPHLPNMDTSSFGNKNSRRMIRMGEEAAEKLLPQLRALKQ